MPKSVKNQSCVFGFGFDFDFFTFLRILTPVLLQFALDEVVCSETISKACKKYNIPYGSLFHRVKRAIIEDAFNNDVTISEASEKYCINLTTNEKLMIMKPTSKKGTDENLIEALKAVENGFGVAASVKKYNIPDRTLRNWMKNLKIFNPNTSQKPVESNDMTTPENNLAVEDAFDNQDLIPDEPLDDPPLDSNIEPDRIEG